MDKCDIGIYGLGIMGKNLAINFANSGFSVSVFNRKEDGEENIVDDFIANRCQGKKIIGADSVNDFISSIKKPRKVIITVKAGTANAGRFSQGMGRNYAFITSYRSKM